MSNEEFEKLTTEYIQKVGARNMVIIVDDVNDITSSFSGRIGHILGLLEVSKQQAISICYSKNSFTTSKPATTFNNWILQKRRSASTTVHYRFFHKLVLALFYISQLLFWVTGIILLSFLFNWIIVTSLIAARFLFQYLIIGFSAKKLNEKGLVLFAPFFELFLILIQLFIFMKNIVSKPSN